jgi:thiamine monophosphate synthase
MRIASGDAATCQQRQVDFGLDASHDGRAEQAGADYLIVEPLFFSHYAQGRPPLGPTVVRRIKAKVHLPLLAGGGITAGNAHQVIAAGADGVSVVTEIVEAADPRAAARSLLEAMREAWSTRPLLREAMAG